MAAAMVNPAGDGKGYVGVENLLDQAYRLPLGGAYTAQGRTMAIQRDSLGIAVPGPGRSFYLRTEIGFDAGNDRCRAAPDIPVFARHLH